MKRFLIQIVILSLLIISCGENNVINSDDTSSNLFKYLNPDETNPKIILGQALSKYLIENPEWINSEMTALCEKQDYVNFSDLFFNSRPQVRELDKYLQKINDAVNIESEDIIWIESRKYQIRIERYHCRSVINNNVSSIKTDYGIMLDPDLFNDAGSGILYYSAQNDIEQCTIELSTTAVDIPTYFISFEDITPDDIWLSKTATVNGTYLMLTGIYIDAAVESGNLEVEIFTMGNASAFEYNLTTNHQFNGQYHYDASGSAKLYPDVNNEDKWYYPIEQIALCRLTNDFEQSIIFVENDHTGGSFDQNENTLINDAYYHINCKGLTADGDDGTINSYLDRYFRCFHQTDNNNYDDVNTLSEIRGLKISTVSTTEMTFNSDIVNSPNFNGVRYKLKKVVITN